MALCCSLVAHRRLTDAARRPSFLLGGRRQRLSSVGVPNNNIAFVSTARVLISVDLRGCGDSTIFLLQLLQDRYHEPAERLAARSHPTHFWNANRQHDKGAFRMIGSYQDFPTYPVNAVFVYAILAREQRLLEYILWR